MSKSWVLGLVAGAALCAGASSAHATTVLNVGPSSLCSSSGCFGDSTRIFTQKLSASGGAFDISSLRLSRDVLGNMQDFAVRVTFELADGTKVASWGAFTLAAMGGEVVTIGGQPISWDAAAGDLILKLELLVPGKGGVSGFGGGFAGGGGGLGAGVPDAVGGGSPFGGVMPAALPSAPLRAQPLVAIPEPTTWAMLLLGFGAIGAVLRRRHSPLRYS